MLARRNFEKSPSRGVFFLESRDGEDEAILLAARLMMGAVSWPGAGDMMIFEEVKRPEIH